MDEDTEDSAYKLVPTTVASDGRILVFSCAQFVTDICLGDCCFICGARPGTKVFNGEHVIPRWILRRFDLFDREITLPNGQVRTYGQYKMPCCQDCNTFLSETLETPISEVLAGTYEEITARIDGETIHRLFIWLCLLFLKTHLKDRSVPQNPDPRKSAGWLADRYDWPDLHHLQCVARSTYARASFAAGVLGTIAFFKVEDKAVRDTFDYGDITEDQTVLVRLGDFAIVAVLNDAGAAAFAWRHLLARINGPVSTDQLREIAAMLAAANADLINRPRFGSRIGKLSDGIHLWAQHDGPPEFAPFEAKNVGARLAFLLRDHLPGLMVAGVRDKEQLRELINAGKVTYLWDHDGNFKPQEIRWESDSSGKPT